MTDVIVRPFLDLSTAHLTQDTCDALGSIKGVVAYSTADGWLMYAPEPFHAAELAAAGEWPPEQPIVRLAREHGCAYILFDSDADTTTPVAGLNW
ncbi:hypothetical protein [Dactylosporangium sp. CA-139066]|uniref:DUF5983 family protein n=1 Tax=Dactylosporangium sp. CA-139066 TaxID=3239930 RepID=UPI003D8F5CF9